jgi:hypothetical protein
MEVCGLWGIILPAGHSVNSGDFSRFCGIVTYRSEIACIVQSGGLIVRNGELPEWIYVDNVERLDDWWGLCMWTGVER